MFFNIKLSNLLRPLLLLILFIFIINICLKGNYKNEKNDIVIENSEKSIDTDKSLSKSNENDNIKKEERILSEYQDGFKVIGKIIIKKIGVEANILDVTNEQSLKVSVTKLSGNNINQIGNFCICGHNYKKSNMFGNLYKLKIGDEIVLQDIYGKTLEYQIYNIFTTKSNDISCLQYQNEGDIELTLITAMVIYD